jgi:hypothetical protein
VVLTLSFQGEVVVEGPLALYPGAAVEEVGLAYRMMMIVRIWWIAECL